jgi:hypothetical protein
MREARKREARKRQLPLLRRLESGPIMFGTLGPYERPTIDSLVRRGLVQYVRLEDRDYAWVLTALGEFVVELLDPPDPRT